ncbi:MAG TPA: sugar kinase [Fimbriiglobus sp.]|jgi:2-dehydro-3-deoxygluconokinase
MHEIITFGEAMVRLTPPHFQRLEQARSLDVEIGGAELNTAVGLVRLGHSVAWASRLPESSLGRLVAARVREGGVDDRWIRFSSDGRCGLYFLEVGAAPRASGILYDRKDSAMSRVEPGMFDWTKVLAGAKWFHTSGITAALSTGSAAVTKEGLLAAKAGGLTTSFDLNYRAKLWSPEEAGRVLAGMMPHADVLIASEGDAKTLFGVGGETFAEVAKAMCERFGHRTVAAGRRDASLVWKDRVGAVGYHGGEVFETPTYECEVVDRLGGGDAFAAGLIHGLLEGDFAKGLAYGAAIGALKHTVLGDLPLVSKDEVEAVLAGQGVRIRR